MVKTFFVLPDADLQRAVPAVLSGAFAQAGQNCLGVQRVFVHDAVGTPPVPLPPVPVEPDMPVTPPVVVTPAVPAAFDAPAPPLFGAPGSVVLQAPIATSTAAEEKRLV